MEYLKIKAIKAISQGMCGCECHSDSSIRHCDQCCSFCGIQRDEIEQYVESKTNEELMQIISDESKLKGLR